MAPADALILKQFSDSLAAVAALGIAAMGLVDATKPFWGGVSNFGVKHVTNCLEPFEKALEQASSVWRATIRSHWLNGTALDQQKAVTKSLVRLGLKPENARELANAGKVDAEKFAVAVAAVYSGAQLTTEQITILARFDAAIDIALDAGYERADQKYRNATRVTAGVFAVVLAALGGRLLSSHPQDFWWKDEFWQSVLIGVVSVPLAPIAKDLSSSLIAAVGALRTVRGGG